MRKINRIYVHCSASEWGNVPELDRWHRERGFSQIGYHWVILNQFPTYRAYKDCKAFKITDGQIMPGRLEELAGAHVSGANSDSLGICLVGNEAFSHAQVESLLRLLVEKCQEYRVPVDRVRGHSEWWTDQGQPPKKACPNLPMPTIREQIAARLVSLSGTPGSVSGTPSGLDVRRSGLLCGTLDASPQWIAQAEPL